MIDADEIKDRIQEMIDELQLQPATFADQAGIARSTLNHILNGRNRVSLDVVAKITSAFTEWNSEWILMGRGSKYNQNEHIDSYENDLFGEKISPAPNNAAHTQEKIETKTITVEVCRHVERIMVFYSDGEYQEFIPKVPSNKG